LTVEYIVLQNLETYSQALYETILTHDFDRNLNTRKLNKVADLTR